MTDRASSSSTLPPVSARRRDRDGGVLLIVLGVLAIVLSTVLLASVTFRTRAVLVRDALRRESARDSLLLAVSNAVELLRNDETSIDHPGEPWAQPSSYFPETSPFHADMRSEGERVALATADAPLLAALLRAEPSVREGALPADAVDRYARDILRFRDDWMANHGGEPPPAIGLYADAVPTDAVLFNGLRACATPFGQGGINPNFAPRHRIAAVLETCGAAPDTAAAMADRAARTLDAGQVVSDTRPSSLAALFLGEGVLPTADVANVLSRASGLLATSGPTFRGRFTCRSPALSIEFTYDRQSRRFLRWDEDPAPPDP